MSIKPGSDSKVCPLGVIDLDSVFHVCGLGNFIILFFHKKLNQRWNITYWSSNLEDMNKYHICTYRNIYMYKCVCIYIHTHNTLYKLH